MSVTVAVWQALLAGMARLPSLILALGTLLSAVLACMTFFAGMSRRREEQLREAARELRERIAEREVAQEALRASEERYRSLVDSASDIIYRADPQGHFTFVNPLGMRVMKRTQAELIGLHFLELVDPEWRPEVGRFYAEQFRNRVGHTYFEFPSISGDGGTVWIGQNVQLLQDDDTVVGFQAVARDITERRQADVEVARARDAALESDRLKSEFVANVSHELRTPMNGVLGLTDLLLETDLTPEQREHAVTVRECGENLLALLNDILDLSKVAAGKLEIQAVAFDLRRLLRQITELFAEKARIKRVELVYLVHHEVPDAVLGDPGRVRQVLTNLLANAVKFTERGEITVRVTSEPSADGGALLRVEVADTGIGVSPEAQAQLFQPFVQADGSITRKYGGTGLGLVISRQLAELMGGEMGMSSQLGQGSTFWFTLRATPASPAELQPGNADPSLQGLRVLALDDSETSRQRLRMLLESWHMRVSVEASADGALRTLETAAKAGQRFDIVLVDLRSVAVTELDFAATLRQSGLVSHTRIVLISGRGQRGDAQRARELGVSAYLSKPIRPSDLFDCLATVMRPMGEATDTADRPGGLVTRYTLKSQQQDRLKGPLLVVEDNLVNQKVLVGLLGKLQYKADVANNGIEALEALQRASYPLVLMDSQMPQMDGFATTAEIRRREGTTHRTIIVAVTAHAMTGERERCLAAGMDDYMSKPVSLDRLRAILDRWLAAEPAESPARVAEIAPSVAPTAETIMDPSVLGRLRDLERDAPGFVADVVSLFLQETPGRIDAIGAALAQADGSRLAAAAHALRGSAGAIGATRLAELCACIEDCAHRRALADCTAPAASLSGAFNAVRVILQRDYLPRQSTVDSR